MIKRQSILLILLNLAALTPLFAQWDIVLNKITIELHRNLLDEGPKKIALAQKLESEGNIAIAEKVYQIVIDAYFEARDFQAIQHLINEVKHNSKNKDILYDMDDWQSILDDKITEEKLNNFNHFAASLDANSTPNAKAVADELQQALAAFIKVENTPSNKAIINKNVHILKLRIAGSDRFFTNALAQANDALDKKVAFKALADANAIISLIDAFIPVINDYPDVVGIATEKNNDFKTTYDIASREVTKKFSPK